MIPENATLLSIFLLGKGIHEKTPCDVTACRREYLRTAPGSEEVVDRLGARTSLEFYPLCELSCYLLTVCVVKYQSAELSLPMNCCLSTLVICARTIIPVPLLRVFLHICK
ncbi:hypothetical protein AVEN_237928-1 [Araneus ventricosus]|uniref:Uncharacterized protein n=1 Tax=Araneus ventricosus TaxID=182803 RepID=A0A4Y2E5H6_ARAVE|nr:hypothetical protein AVEN_237928-1 [Araneus ventricosus]